MIHIARTTAYYITWLVILIEIVIVEMLDDRPIKPDRQYLDAYIEKMSSQVDKK